MTRTPRPSARHYTRMRIAARHGTLFQKLEAAAAARRLHAIR